MLTPDLSNPPSRTFGIIEDTPKGHWDPLIQQFIPHPTNTTLLDHATAKSVWTNLLNNLIADLDQKPAVRTIHKGILVEHPPRSICCLHCKSPDLIVPLKAIANPNTGIVTTLQPGKGDVHCPDCGKTDTKAKVTPYNMYTYADLVRARHTYLNTLLEWKNSLDDLLA